MSEFIRAILNKTSTLGHISNIILKGFTLSQNEEEIFKIINHKGFDFGTIIENHHLK